MTLRYIRLGDFEGSVHYIPTAPSTASPIAVGLCLRAARHRRGLPRGCRRGLAVMREVAAGMRSDPNSARKSWRTRNRRVDKWGIRSRHPCRFKVMRSNSGRSAAHSCMPEEGFDAAGSRFLSHLTLYAGQTRTAARRRCAAAAAAAADRDGLNRCWRAVSHEPTTTV